MKFRNGFVSNSSSTSFVCQACGNSWMGWDWEDDPICSKCGCHIYGCKESFIHYVLRVHDLDEEKERARYLKEQGYD